jgi:hypothetical protein
VFLVSLAVEERDLFSFYNCLYLFSMFQYVLVSLSVCFSLFSVCFSMFQ